MINLTKHQFKICEAEALGLDYYYIGENIAAGQTSPERVMTAWMNSEGHRANILNASFTRLGVGGYADGGLQRLLGRHCPLVESHAFLPSGNLVIKVHCSP